VLSLAHSQKSEKVTLVYSGCVISWSFFSQYSLFDKKTFHMHKINQNVDDDKRKCHYKNVLGEKFLS
jgi:hypothetical protein